MHKNLNLWSLELSVGNIHSEMGSGTGRDEIHISTFRTPLKIFRNPNLTPTLIKCFFHNVSFWQLAHWSMCLSLFTVEGIEVTKVRKFMRLRALKILNRYNFLILKASFQDLSIKIYVFPKEKKLMKLISFFMHTKIKM